MKCIGTREREKKKESHQNFTKCSFNTKAKNLRDVLEFNDYLIILYPRLYKNQM